MKDFLNWRTENHKILSDIEILLYERAVAVAEFDISHADRIRRVIFENIDNLSSAEDDPFPCSRPCDGECQRGLTCPYEE